MTTTITITKPDDWHIHLRDGNYLLRTVPDAANQFKRVLVMPNLQPPITTVSLARDYQHRILSHLPSKSNFQPWMTLYLTDHTPPTEITQAKESGIILACKLYPANATTHSEAGVTKIEKIYPVLEKMQDVDLPLAIHGEMTGNEIDVFDREKYFIEKILIQLVRDFPKLRISLEHISTQQAVAFIQESAAHVAATITAHHLLLNRNALFQGGIHPHHYCLPVLKRQEHQKALIQAAISGNPKFFLGTDSAPHSQHAKEKACGCAGIYTAHAAMELYAEVFDEAQALDKLEGFSSHFGADFYKLPRNQDKIVLTKESWQAPETLNYADNQLIPLRAGNLIQWKLSSQAN